jgi:hypothetical protein
VDVCVKNEDVCDLEMNWGFAPPMGSKRTKLICRKALYPEFWLGYPWIPKKLDFAFTCILAMDEPEQDKEVQTVFEHLF